MKPKTRGTKNPIPKGSQIGALDHHETKNTGDKKPRSQRDHTFPGVWGEKIHDPEGVEQPPFYVFADVASRCDAEGVVN